MYVELVPKALPVLDVSAAVCCSPLAAGAMSEDDALQIISTLEGSQAVMIDTLPPEPESLEAGAKQC